MAQDDPDTAIRETPIGRRRARTAVKWTAIALGALLLLLLGFILWLNTDLGRSYVVRQINAMETASGLDIDVGRIEGSVFGELTLHDLKLRDPKGLFFTAPEAKIDYRPLAYFRNHIDIRSIDIKTARLLRLPELRAGDPERAFASRHRYRRRPFPDRADRGRPRSYRLPSFAGPRRNDQDRRRPRPDGARRRSARSSRTARRRQAAAPPRRGARAEQARHGNAAGSAGGRIHRRRGRVRSAAGGGGRRQGQLGELERPCPRQSRRQGFRQSRRRRARRNDRESRGL